MLKRDRIFAIDKEPPAAANNLTLPLDGPQTSRIYRSGSFRTSVITRYIEIENARLDARRDIRLPFIFIKIIFPTTRTVLSRTAYCVILYFACLFLPGMRVAFGVDGKFRAIIAFG